MSSVFALERPAVVHYLRCKDVSALYIKGKGCCLHRELLDSIDGSERLFRDRALVY
jgi:hypothetical protein